MIPARSGAGESGRRTGGPAPRRRGRAAVLVAVGFLAFFGGIAALIAVLTRDDGDRRPAAATAPEEAGSTPGSAAARATAAGSARAGGATDGVPGGGPAAEHLARAQALAQAHRETVLNSTPGGARQAEAEVLEAFRQGAADIPGAWRILADVYDVQIEWTADAERRAEYRRKEREALERVLEADPGDGEARFQHATLLEDRGTRILELTRAVKDLPRDPRPRRALADDLLTAGRTDEALRLLVEAAQLYGPQELQQQGPTIVNVLRSHGREREAAQVRARMQQPGR